MKSVIVVVISLIFLIPSFAFSQSQIHIQTDSSQYSSGESIFVTGKLIVAGGNSVFLSLFFGDELVQEKRVSVARDGSFKTTFLTGESFLEKTGTYTVSVFYDDYDPMWQDKPSLFGETEFSYTSEQKQIVTIPEWIKNNVKWWADGLIDDSAFVSGIEFLISDGVIDVPVIQKSINTTGEIPMWVRTNAEWWADGEIPDSDFVKGIEYLENSGIIQVAQTDPSSVVHPSLDLNAGPSDDRVEIIQESWMCSGNARCFTGIVTQVIDGDTIKVDNKSIRFAMASSPELDEVGGIESRQFIEEICSVGSIATVDEDDEQTQGSYGRILGVVYCNGFNLNSDLLDFHHGYLITDFCDFSEFVNKDWAQKHGCSDVSEDIENNCPSTHPYLWSDGFCYTESEYLENGCSRNYPHLWSDGMCYDLPEPVYDDTPQCDSSYPDFCIAPDSRDLDCDEIPYTDFRVYQPDPHEFDADHDGIGCESYSHPPTESTSVDCDPSYPDFCIPPPPPDLDCGDISQKNFTVLQPDPHRFDGNKDGIGCES